MPDSQPPQPPERVPSDAPPPRRRGSLLRRTLLLLLLVLVLATGAVFTFPDQLLLPWVLPAAQAAARARGLELSVAHLGGSLTDTLELRDVRVTTRDPSLPEAELVVPDVQLRWSLWRALTGGADPLDGLSLHGGTLHLHLTPDDDSTPEAPWEVGTLVRWGRQFDALPELSVDGLRVELRMPSEGRLNTPELAARATLFVDGSRVELRDGQLDGDGPEGLLPGGASLRVPLHLDLSHLAQDELPFDLDLSVLGGVVTAEGRVQGPTVAAALTARGIELADAWRAATGGDEPSPVSGPMLLDAKVRVLFGDGAVSTVTASVTLGALRAWGVPLDSATGGLTLDDGALRVSDVKLAQGSNLLVLKRVGLPAGADRDALNGTARLTVGDLPALLAALRAADLLPTLPDSPGSALAQRVGAQAVAGEHSLALDVALHDGVARVTDAQFVTPGGSLTVSEASFDLRAADRAEAALFVRLEAAFTDLSPLGALLGEQPFPGALSTEWGGALTAYVDVSGSLRAPVAVLDVDGRGVLLAGWPLGSVTVQATADANEVVVSALDVQAGAAHVSAQGALELDTLSVRDMRMQVQVPDLAAALPDSGLRGALDASATLDGPLPAPLGSIELHIADLLVHGVAVDELQLAATHEPGQLVVSRAQLMAPWGTLEAAGSLHVAKTVESADPTGAADTTASAGTTRPADLSLDAWLDTVTSVRLDRLALTRGALDLSLTEPATLEHVRGGGGSGDTQGGHAQGGRLWSGGPLEFRGSAGVLRATLLAAPSASGSGLLQRVQLVAERLQPLLPLPAGSRVETLDGDIDVAFSADEIIASGTLRALGLALVVPGSSDGSATAAEPGDKGAVTGVSGDVTLWLSVSGSPHDPRGEAEVSGRHVLLTDPSRFAPEGIGPFTLDGHVTFGDSLVIDWLHVDSPQQVRFDARGTLDLPDDPLRPWAETPVQLVVSVAAGQLERLAARLPDVRRMSGDFEAELTLDGTLGAPRAAGSIAVHDGELRLHGALPALDALEARLELADGRLTIREFTGELGSAPFSLTGEGWLGPDGPLLDVVLSGEDLLLYRADGVTVRADSRLSVRGAPTALHVEGSLALRNSGIVSSVNLLHFAQGGNAGPTRGPLPFSFREPPMSTVVFNVHITSAEPFVVRNNVVRGKLIPDLRLTGTGLSPILDGALSVEAARVLLPAGSVNLDSGRVLFSAADPFVPRLDLAASARRRGYDISLRITGPYDQPVVSLSSVPPLASDKILMLLLTGQAPGRSSSGPAGADTTTHVVSVYLGQDLLARWLGDSPLDEESLLDRLDVDVVKDVSRTDSELLQVSYRLSPLPRRGGTVTFLRAEKDLYGRINFGVQFLFRIEP